MKKNIKLVIDIVVYKCKQISRNDQWKIVSKKYNKNEIRYQMC